MHEGYYRGLRRPLYITACTWHDIRKWKPHTERGIIKNLPVALCGVVTGPLGGLRRGVRRSPDSQDAHSVCLNHRRSRYKTTKHARSRPHSNVRQAWIVSGAINISTRTYITHHQQGLSAAAARDDPRQVLFTPCQTQIMDRNKLEV